MLKILQARLQQYVNRELPGLQAGFRKGRGIRYQIANICWIIEKAREFQKNIYFCFTDHTKALDCVDHNKLWKILKRDGNTRPPYDVSWETCMQVKKQQLEPDMANNWFKIGKGVQQGYILSPCLCNLYAEFTMQNVKLNYKLESRFLGEISTTSDMQMIPLLGLLRLGHRAKRN